MRSALGVEEFKVFRNEMYSYIDKCLVLSRERDQ
jgi:hypothetical protein